VLAEPKGGNKFVKLVPQSIGRPLSELEQA
jgi:hypothetical protein